VVGGRAEAAPGGCPPSAIEEGASPGGWAAGPRGRRWGPPVGSTGVLPFAPPAATPFAPPAATPFAPPAATPLPSPSLPA
jgi:hypothetical protein